MQELRRETVRKEEKVKRDLAEVEKVKEKKSSHHPNEVEIGSSAGRNKHWETQQNTEDRDEFKER